MASGPHLLQQQTVARRDFFNPGFRIYIVLALVVGVARRLLVGWDVPLWLDEAFTGAIALQPTLAGLLEDCLNELSGPVYYTLMWAWVKLAGASDVAMRLPSLIFALAAPMIILIRGHGDRAVRWLWAALAALWLPGIVFGAEARAYSLLFLLAAAQIVAFQRLLEVISLRRALLWCGISVLLILTHYYTLLLVGLQGLGYLALGRKAAFRTWPAALLFVPVAAWMTIHLPVLFRFAQPGVAWQRVLTFRELPSLSHLFLGLGSLSHILGLLIVVTVAINLHRSLRKREPWPFTPIEMVVVGASVLGMIIIFAIGFVRPSFTPRYLMAYMPGVLLGLALWARAWGRRWRPLPWGLIAFYMFACLHDLSARLADPKLDFRRGYSWEAASDYLRAQGVRRVLFLWDNPSAATGDPGQHGRVGAFFFHRLGNPVVGETVKAPGVESAMVNALLAAADRPGPQPTGTLILGPILDLGRFDKRWTCKFFGGPKVAYNADVHVSACYRRAVTGPT